MRTHLTACLTVSVSLPEPSAALQSHDLLGPSVSAAEDSSLLGCDAATFGLYFGQAVLLDCLSLKAKDLTLFETSGTIHPTARRHTPE
jgi:hypothetical protein